MTFNSQSQLLGKGLPNALTFIKAIRDHMLNLLTITYCTLPMLGDLYYVYGIEQYCTHMDKLKASQIVLVSVYKYFGI